MESLLQAENISKSYGDLVLFENISISISKGHKTALIAINGAGKTSILNILAGLDKPDSGLITKKKSLSIAYLDQEPELNDYNSILDEIFGSGDDISMAIKNYQDALKSTDKDILQTAIDKMDGLDAWGHEVRVKQILTKFNINDYFKKISELSGGQKKRLALAKVLINEPDLILLDEPTNHLDLNMIEWLEEYLKNTSSTVFMVTHDRYFLDRICTEIVELSDNEIYSYSGNYTYYLDKRTERISIKKANIEKANNLLKKELDWVRRMPKARATKAKSRLDAFKTLKVEASAKIDDNVLSLDIEPRRLGKKILEISNLCKAYDKLNLINDFSYKFQKYEKVGIIGPNGSGKTTFLDIITGLTAQDSGEYVFGDSIVYGYYQQSGIQIDNNKRVIDIVKDVSELIYLGNGKKLSARQFLEYFMFPHQMHYSLVSKLSGGEKRRLYLLTVLMKNPNFLIFDEPTNDLDIVTLNVLEEYLSAFKGCLVIVSHDRFFLDKIVDHTFVFGENGQIKDFPGNYSVYRDYVANMTLKSLKSEIIKPEKKNKPERSQNLRLSYKEKTEFEKLENELPVLEKEKQKLEMEVNSGKLSTEELFKKSQQLQKVIEELDIKELRWLELSEKN